MQSGTYRLQDDRKVLLRSVSVARTYGGVLAGSRKTASKMVLEALRAQAESARPPEPPILLIAPERLPLPDYMWTAELELPKGVRTRDPDYGSHLSVSWFSESLVEGIDDVMASLVRSLDMGTGTLRTMT